MSHNIYITALVIRHASDGKMYLYDVQDIKKESASKLPIPQKNAISKNSSGSLNNSIPQNPQKSTTSAKKVSGNNGSGRRALPKVDGEDMVARAYERGMGAKSQTGENSEANAAERDFGFPIDVIKTESPAPPTAIGGTPAAERGLELSTNSIHQNKAIVNKIFLMAD